MIQNKKENKMTPNPVDMYVGGRLKERRMDLKLSQAKLAGKLGLTFQQLQKYEKGDNRIGSSRLYELSIILDVPVSYFFEHYGSLSKDSRECKNRSEIKKLSRDVQKSIRMLEAVESDVLRKSMVDAMKVVYDLFKRFKKEMAEKKDKDADSDENK